MRTVPLLFALLLIVSLLAAPVAADHPGSNAGLSRYADAGTENLVHRLPDVDAKFAAWEAAYPHLVDRLDAGTTGSGFPLLAIRVTDEAVTSDGADLSTGEKLVVYLDGGHHGNEFLGVDLVMYYLEDLLHRADAGDQEVLTFLARTEVYALPIVNVDGNTLDTRKNIRQVDPNRNYGFQWGGPGSGGMITDLNYRGPSAFSEPEVQANADFAAALGPDLWITMHTGVAEFYWPWGWTHAPSPDDAFFSSLEAPFENATNGRVDAMQAAELYLAAGATDDYGYAVLGVPTFTYEVHEDQFVPLYGDPIPVVISDQLAGLEFMVQNVRFLGGWVETTVGDGVAVLHNEGWGSAWNATVTVDGLTYSFTEIAPGARVEVPLPEDAASLRVDYQVLRIETSIVRTHVVSLGDAPDGFVDEEVPALAPLVMLVLLGLALVAMRRRG